MLQFFSLLLALVVSPSAFSSGKFVTLKDGVSRYVEISMPSIQVKNKALPTVVLVNGLVYDLSRWEELKKNLNQKGYKVLTYYMRGQFKTLRAEVEKYKKPLFFKSGLSREMLADELEEIRLALVPNDSLVVVGLSFGSAVASEYARKYPEAIQDIFYFAPLVLPTDRYNPQGQWIFQNLEWIKLWWGPFLGPRFYDEVYNWIYRAYLKQRIVPERIPDEMQDLAEEYKEAIFHLVRATRDFDLKAFIYRNDSQFKAHYFLAKEETAEIFKDQVTAYDQTRVAQKGVFIFLEESAHAIPDSQPVQATRYLDLVVQRDSRIKDMKKYRANSEGLFLFEEKIQ